MSASREKKRRQEYLAANGGVDPKAEREAARQKAEKRSSALYTGIAIVFAIAAAIVLIKTFVLDANFMQRGRTALTINGEEYTVADVSYYYYNAYQNEMVNGYAAYFIDTTQPLSLQQYIFDTSKTWAEHFREQAVSTMQLVHAAAKAAEAEGMTLTEEQKETLANQIAYTKEQAEANNYSYKEYLVAMYGKYMTPAVYEKNLERTLLASAYTSAHYDSLTYTDDEVLAYYEENKNSFDRVDGAYVTISGTPETKKDESGNTIEATDEEKSEALATAKNNADLLLAGYQGGDDLEALAETLGATYTGDVELSYTSNTAMDWLFDESRVAGDCEILLDKETSTYYVVVFNSRHREEALSYNVRHILITEANLNLAEGEEAGENEVLLAAQKILDDWKAGEMTEDAFAALAKEYTQDSGSVANGGLYEDVLKGNMIAEFEDWCYAEGRKAGDTGIVESTYGQHIMYFVGYGEDEYWHTACHTALANEDYTTWETELLNSAVVELNDNMNLVA